jgi:arylsulfatase A-like enzyme
MRWPSRLPAGRVVSSLVSTVDLAATVLDAGGMSEQRLRAAAPESLSLLPLAEGRVKRVREDVVSVYHNSGLSNEPGATLYWDPPIYASMLRHGQWKLTVFHGGEGRGWTIQGTLFDMNNDPGETENLFNDPAHLTVRQNLTERLLNWFMEQQLQYGGRGGQTVAQVKMINSLK